MMSRFTWSFLHAFRKELWYVGGLSIAVNLLMLTGAIYMLQVFDRVLTSRSGATLFYITLMMLFLYCAMAFFDDYRNKLLAAIGRQIETNVVGPLFEAVISQSLRIDSTEKNTATIRDLEEVSRLMSSGGVSAVFDLPFMPLFLAICFMFHPIIGFVTLAIVVLVIAIAVFGEILGQKPSREVSLSLRVRAGVIDSSQRHAEVITAMSFAEDMRYRFMRVNERYTQANTRLTNLIISLSGFTRTTRLAAQSVLLGVAAWLVINDLATPGVMIASSVVASRALAPIDALMARWRSYSQAAESWQRLESTLTGHEQAAEVLDLPLPQGEVVASRVASGPPGADLPIISGVSFSLSPGDAVGIVGPSGSGKSTLVRAISGVWPLSDGTIRFDGALLTQYSPRQRADIIGYLPQDVQLLRGTVAENICRFRKDAGARGVIEAAREAEAHEMILALPNGYLTDVGENGSKLSGGQRQRIGLARAMYGQPYMLLLDEPNANLDGQGEQALAQAMASVRRRNGIVVIVAHRMSTLRDVNKLLLLVNGKMQVFGNRDEVLAVMSGRETAPSLVSRKKDQGDTTEGKSLSAGEEHG